MSWGLPPKYETKHQFNKISVTTINQSVDNALMNCDFVKLSQSTYHLRGVKKLGMTFFSFFAFSKPKITVDVFITKSGRVTLKSNYNYGSMFGIALNDRGKQQKEIGKLLTEIIEITKLNHQYNPIKDEGEINDSSTVIKEREEYYND